MAGWKGTHSVATMGRMSAALWVVCLAGRSVKKRVVSLACLRVALWAE